MSSVEGFLGGGGPALKFPTKGTKHTITLTEEGEVTQQTDFDSGEPLFWPDGKPREQLILRGTVDESEREDQYDDGERRLFIKSGLVKAYKAAMREAQAKAPKPGGVVTVEYVSDGPKPARGYAPKIYAMSYTPPKPGAVTKVENFGDEDEPGTEFGAMKQARGISDKPPF